MRAPCIPSLNAYIFSSATDNRGAAKRKLQTIMRKSKSTKITEAANIELNEKTAKLAALREAANMRDTAIEPAPPVNVPRQAPAPVSDADAAQPVALDYPDALHVNRRVNYTAHDSATIDAAKYPLAEISNRDESYIAFFARCARGEAGHAVTLASIAAQYKRNPYYAGSAKSTDAGAIQRAVKAGFLHHDADARTIMLTETGIAYGNGRLRLAHGFLND